MRVSEPVVLVALQERGAAVRAAVVVDDEVVHAQRGVIGDPLLEVVGLVLDDADDDDAEGGAAQERSAARDVGRLGALHAAAATGRSRHRRRCRGRRLRPLVPAADDARQATAQGHADIRSPPHRRIGSQP